MPSPPWRLLRVAAAVVTVAASLALLSASTSKPPSSTPSAPVPVWQGPPQWGVAGGYSGIGFRELEEFGTQYALAEMVWEEAEPSEGVFDEAYLAHVRREVLAMRAAGLEVVLNMGMDRGPQWILDRPGARFIDQDGHVYTESDEVNLVFGTGLRPAAAEYVRHVLTALGDSVSIVRVGGGHWGELTYPRERGPAGSVDGSYWAFDANAVKTTPVPGWEPGEPSPHGEAAAFLEWYLDSLVEYQNWQVETVKRYFGGTVAVLYPSWGMRPGDFEAAVGGGLDGTSSAERNREVQSGIDHARAVEALDPERTAVWCTWADAASDDPGNPAPFVELGRLAAARGLLLMGENSGDATTVAAMERMARVGREHGAKLLLWVRADDLLAGSSSAVGDRTGLGPASLDHFSRVARGS